MRPSSQTYRVPLSFSRGLASGPISTMEKSYQFISIAQAPPTSVCTRRKEPTTWTAAATYGAQKHVVVTFILEGISESELDEFNHQNVLSNLTLSKVPNGYKLEMAPCFGLNGTITARSVRIELEPGMPSSS